MRRWWLVILLLLSVGVNVGLVVSRVIERRAGSSGPNFQGPPPWETPGEGPREDLPPGMERLADHLGLEGDLRGRFLEIQSRLFQAVRGAGQRRRELQWQLRRELTAEEPNRQRVEEIVDQMAVELREMESGMAAAVLDTREILDPEQERIYMKVLARLGGGARGGPFGDPRRPSERRPRWRERP